MYTQIINVNCNFIKSRKKQTANIDIHYLIAREKNIIIFTEIRGRENVKSLGTGELDI